MTLEQAIDAHIRESIYTSSFGDPREVIQVGPVKVIRDAPGRKRDPRRQTIVISGVDPDEAVKAVKSYAPKHWALSVIERSDADHVALKDAYKARGYRLLIRFPFFAMELNKKLPRAGDHVMRAALPDRSPLITHRNHRLLVASEGNAQSDETIRIYASFNGKVAIGWVQSIRVSDESTWVSNLWVDEKHRGKGLGSALMSRMLTTTSDLEQRIACYSPATKDRSSIGGWDTMR